MKKKNLLMMALSLCLVAVVAVGGTLAYLTDTDDQMKNTFTFANNLEVTLDEDTPDSGLGNATVAWDDTQHGLKYENVVVGQTLPKVPTVELSSYSVDAYVFAKIENKTEGVVSIVDLKTTDNGGAWTDCGSGIYGRKVTIDTEHPADSDTATPLFTQVKIEKEPAASASDINITISVSAIQATGFDTMDAALAAVTEWSPVVGG